MEQSYFLGANSANGFVGNYASFCSGAEDYLYVIKGGPGCGKSTFMKKLAQIAAQQGYAVERIFCSGDPESLDAVFFPALHIGYVDGTAPHISEPRILGVNGEYLDFSTCLDLDALRTHSREIQAAHTAYKNAYQNAYDFLAIYRRYGSVRLFGSCRFARALTCCGIASFALPESTQTVSEAELHKVAEQAHCIDYRNPLWCERTEAVYLPDENRFLRAEIPLPDCSKAISHLAEAKQIHDELEGYYRQAADFSVIDRLLEVHREKYFGKPVASSEKM